MSWASALVVGATVDQLLLGAKRPTQVYFTAWLRQDSESGEHRGSTRGWSATCSARVTPR